MPDKKLKPNTHNSTKPSCNSARRLLGKHKSSQHRHTRDDRDGLDHRLVPQRMPPRRSAGGLAESRIRAPSEITMDSVGGGQMASAVLYG